MASNSRRDERFPSEGYPSDRRQDWRRRYADRRWIPDTGEWPGSEQDYRDRPPWSGDADWYGQSSRERGQGDYREQLGYREQSGYMESEPYGGREHADPFRRSYGPRERSEYGGYRQHESEWPRVTRNVSDFGEFFGKGPRDYQRSDERIREDVCDELTYAPDVDASDVVVAVAEGEVTLTGEVPDRFAKRRSEEIAENVRGVRDVHNRLQSRRGLVGSVVHEMTRGSEDPRNIGRGPTERR